MAAEDEAYNAAFRRAGIIRVDTISQLFDCAEALEKMQRPLGDALGIITNAGAPGVMAVDALGRWNTEPGVLSPETLAKLDEFLPPYWSRGNPVDLLGTATVEHYLQAVKVGMEAPEFSGLVIILVHLAMTDPAGVARAIIPEVQGKARPVLAVWMGGEGVAEGAKILSEAGIPTFETPEDAVDTFMEMYHYTRHLQFLQQTPPRMPQELQINIRTARTFIDQCLEEGESKILTELESKAILSAYGIPVNPTVAASSGPDAALAAKVIGFPVALKVNSPDIGHKSVVGGVRLNLKSESEVLDAFQEMI
jgi:acetyltransferase